MSEPRVSDERLALIASMGPPILTPKDGRRVDPVALAVLQEGVQEHYRMALDLRDARRELAAMRPVVEAAVAWRKHPGSGNPDSPVAHTAWTDETRALMRSVDNLPPEMRPKGGSQ